MKTIDKPLSDKKKSTVSAAEKSRMVSSRNTTKTKATQKTTSRKSTALEKFSPAQLYYIPKIHQTINSN